MSARATIVVGANFGDEGKGLVTDFLASQKPSTIVVRFNGGAQAGHTVTVGNRRHIFSHFGAGTLAGAPTFLSEYFITNPRFFVYEAKELGIDVTEPAVPISPAIYVDERSLLTTPFDWLINHAREEARGANRHGSCGAGIHETVVRCEAEGGKFATRVSDLHNILGLWDKLITIRDQYFLPLMNSLGLSVNYDLIDDQSLRLFAGECLFFRRVTRIVPNAGVLTRFQHIVCEGAQGLLLDQDHEFFPHVTHSKTGILNATQLLREIGIEQAVVVYVTRSYLTRHGAGPLPGETAPYNIIDQTNVPNRHQGALRFAPLDVELLSRSIRADLANAQIHVIPYLAMTWLDWLESEIRSEAESQGTTKSPLALAFAATVRADRAARACGLPLLMTSNGPTRSDVMYYGDLPDS